MRKAWVIGALTISGLAAALVAANVARTIGQLRALAATAAQSTSALAAVAKSRAAAPAPPPPAATPAEPETAAASQPPVPALSPTPGYRPPERRVGFDAEAMRAAIEAEPSIGELVNDPDPKVRAAILAFFENE